MIILVRLFVNWSRINKKLARLAEIDRHGPNCFGFICTRMLVNFGRKLLIIVFVLRLQRIKIYRRLAVC